MADLGTHFSIGDTLTIPFQARGATGALADADSVPSYRIYEEGGTTAVTTGNGAKRDDANTTGYYEASVSLLAATGFEVGKSYTIYKTATIGGVATGAIDTFAITGAAASTVSALTGWPAVADVQAKLSVAGITLRDDADSDYIQLIINAVVAELLQATKREYVETAEATRYYDGSGTGRQVVDPMVSLTSVELIGYTADPPLLEVENIYLENRQGYPRNQLLIRQGSAPATGYWLTAFPQGRANIAVTGTFGYGEAIPQDVWEAVAGESAERLAMEAMFSQGGILEQWHETEASEKYRLVDRETGMYWHRNYLMVIKARRKPFQERLLNLRAPMV